VFAALTPAPLLPPARHSALQEAKFPPGPRLLILHHVNQFRNPSDVLKPGLPPPPMPAPMRAPVMAPPVGAPPMQMQQRA
jgi:hypothetical protein